MNSDSSDEELHQDSRNTQHLDQNPKSSRKKTFSESSDESDIPTMSTKKKRCYLVNSDSDDEDRNIKEPSEDINAFHLKGDNSQVRMDVNQKPLKSSKIEDFKNIQLVKYLKGQLPDVTTRSAIRIIKKVMNENGSSLKNME